MCRIEGKQKWIPLNLPSRKNGRKINQREAEKRMREILNSLDETPHLYDKILFVDYLKQWLSEVEPTLKPSTYEGYEKVVNGKLIPYFEDKEYYLHELKGQIFTDYFVYLKEYGREDGKGGLKKKGVLNIRGVLSSAFQHAVENDMLKYNYIERSKIPIYAEDTDEDVTPDYVVYTPEQVKTLLEYAEKSKSSMYLFLCLECNTGARKGELCAAEWKDIDWEKSTIHIRHNRTGSKKEVLSKHTTPKSDNSVRILPISSKVLSLLKAEKEKQAHMKKLLGNAYFEDKYDYIIRKDGGGAYNPNSINRIINKMMVKIGLPHCRVHDFRAFVATYMIENEVSIADVSLQLGHGQISTTERHYVKRQRQAKAENLTKVTASIGL